MSIDSVEFVRQVNRLHRETVARWHTMDPDNRYEDELGTVCQQHQFNFLLWHEEDVARSRDVSDARIAMVKRAIDGYNQQRNDWIEKLDDAITDEIELRRIAPVPGAPMNTETPGSVIDRLSILALRIYHLREELAQRALRRN